MRRREVTIPTLIGLFVAVAGLGSGLVLLRGQLNRRVAAAADEMPINVRVANISDTSFSVVWTTAKAVSGYVQYAEGQEEPDLVVSDERDLEKGAISNYFTHLVNIRGLREGTKYRFKIGSGKTMYGNPDQAYEVTTAPTLDNPPAADVAYGQVVTANNEAAEGTIVYLEMPGVSPQATLVRSSGSWVIPLATARSEALTEYAKYDPENGVFTLKIDGGPLGQATADVAMKNHAPVAQITLGESYDLKGEAGPEINKFRGLSGETGEDGPVKLLTPQIGERVNSLRPEIIGEAPAGTVITIEVHSDEVITGSVTTPADGKFNYSVPADLSPGIHTVTVSALIDGIIQKVTTSFVVYAQGESTLPYYSATSSGQLSPTPRTSPSATPRVSPTATPRVSATPTPTTKVTMTVTVTPTRTPTPTLPPHSYNPATESALPETGVLDFTWGILLAGMVLVSGGAWWYKRLQ